MTLCGTVVCLCGRACVCLHMSEHMCLCVIVSGSKWRVPIFTLFCVSFESNRGSSSKREVCSKTAFIILCYTRNETLSFYCGVDEL